jgi:hypothetical protein
MNNIPLMELYSEDRLNVALIQSQKKTFTRNFYLNCPYGALNYLLGNLNCPATSWRKLPLRFMVCNEIQTSFNFVYKDGSVTVVIS